MVTLTARIELNKQGGFVNNVALNNNETVNIASGISSALGKHTQLNYNEFTFNESALGLGKSYADNINYFISRYTCNEEGVFISPFILNVTGSNIKLLTIVFNEQALEYPKSLIVDGVEIFDDDPRWEIEFKNQADTHTIEIKNWNKPYSPLVVTSIYADLSIDMDKANLLSLNRSIRDRQDVQEPVYGIISNYGNCDIIDFDENILDLIKQGVFAKELAIDIYVKNTTENKINQIAQYNISQITYQNENRQVSIEVKDVLEQWQNININAIDYDFENGHRENAAWYYNQLYQITKSFGYDIMSFAELDSDVQNVLNNTTVQYPFLESSSLWEEWNKLCERCFLFIYQNNLGKIVVEYNGT